MPLPQPARQLEQCFQERFGIPPAAVARAPGRVNLIGEHTDYNDGFVLPVALEQSTRVAAAPRADSVMQVVARDLDDTQSWPIDDWQQDQHPHWTSYVAGVAALLRNSGAPLPGCNLLIHSEVPIGGGLSSSAALEVATAQALATLGDVQLAPTRLADLARAAEHQFARVPCGIMDQYVSVLAQADCAFLLDCRTREWQQIPLRLVDDVVLIVDSGVKHSLAAGEYAIRQEQCTAAVEYFRQVDPQIRALRDVSEELIARHAGQMEAKAAARARHVVTENARTLAAADALRHNDLDEFGRLMLASHQSLRDDYEVSCAELDLLVDIIREVPGVRGVRMTGGGFGGCVVAIAQRECVAPVKAALQQKYDAAGRGPARVILTRPGQGASIELP
jgi:galactokinase